jgi:Tol biopolymer transport system component
MIGKTISHYKILEKLGEGGMGVVYKAKDLKLDRLVALKFLPPQLGGDAEEKQRFIHEAKAASALEHTNICNIHEIDETEEGQLFIAMAYYTGDTLRQKIRKGPLPLDQAIDIAIQVGIGLNEAHENKIVHRDIKAANIMITRKNQVKIMDFGLAKLSGKSKITKTGTTLGTTPYMSPEQARGEKTDRRTDIWSLGVLLYEMITGQTPFQGEYEQAILFSILNDDPVPMTGLRTGVPVELERVVNKALTKKCEGRYQHVDELLVDLRSVREKQSKPKEIKRPSRKRVNPLVYVSGILVVVVLLIAGMLLMKKSPGPPEIIRTRPLTTAPGIEEYPTWSPDGSRIAYDSNESGNWDIWIKQVATGQKMNLTQSHTGFDKRPVWSPDGEWIAFISDRHGGGIFIMPSLGGSPNLVMPCDLGSSRFGIHLDLSWSPDSKELVYAEGLVLYTIRVGNDIPKQVFKWPQITGWFTDSNWSPDGERIAFTRREGLGVTVSEIWSVQSDGLNPHLIIGWNNRNRSPIWVPDGRGLLFISDRAGSQDIWWTELNTKGLPKGLPQPVTTGSDIQSFVLSENGTKLAMVKATKRSNIWSIPIVLDRTLSIDDGIRLTSENQMVEHLDISPDGQWIAFDSNRGGNMDIWMMRKDGSNLKQVTTDPAHDWAPQWSPDGKRIIFYSLRSGNRDIFIKPVAGGAVHQLTTDPADDRYPAWSPNGQRIAFSSYRTGNSDVWVKSLENGDLQQITTDNGSDSKPLWHPDSQSIVFTSDRTGEPELFITTIEGGEPRQLTDGDGLSLTPHSWSLDRQIIYAYGGRPADVDIPRTFWAISVKDGSSRMLIKFEGLWMGPFYSLSTDHERIYFPVQERSSDIWLGELAWE